LQEKGKYLSNAALEAAASKNEAMGRPLVALLSNLQ